VRAEARPPGGGVESFDTPEALRINEARLEHLASLDLPLSGRSVLEVGAGVGHLTRFFVERDCRVVVTEGRAENVRGLARRHPAVAVHQADVEESLQDLGRFDVVSATAFCITSRIRCGRYATWLTCAPTSFSSRRWSAMPRSRSLSSQTRRRL